MFFAVADIVWTGLIVALTGLVNILAVCLSRYLSSQENKAVSAKVEVISDKVEQTSINVEKVEKATNSMKDALVKATGDAAFLEGEKHGREQEKGK